MDKIVDLVKGIPSTRSKNDDDFLDRLSSRYTVVICVIFAVVVTMQQYVGKAITCWVPKHFTDSHKAYTNSYCWVRNTYYLPYEEDIPEMHERRQEILYYQWIPFILLGQAVLFYCPSVVWHGLNQRSGVDADDILAAAHTFDNAQKVGNRKKMLGLIANQIGRFLNSRKSSKDTMMTSNKRLSFYLIALYLFVKLLYIANVIFQLFVLNGILGTQFNLYGANAVADHATDHDWMNREHVTFPRVTMCDFKVRRLGNIHRYTVQCVLPINMYTEKIYIFLWFWMVFVALMSVIGFVQWTLRAVIPSDRYKFVLNHLRLGLCLKDDDDAEDKKEFLQRFVTEFLKHDGAFLLRLIAHNTNNITVTDIICQLWRTWFDEHKHEPVTHYDTNDGTKDDTKDDASEADDVSDPATAKRLEAEAAESETQPLTG